MAVFRAVVKRFWPAIAWGIGILVLTGIPGQDIPKMPKFVLAPDKIAHFAIFTGFAFLLLKGFGRDAGMNMRKAAVVTLLITAFYGALTEILQATLFINRQGSLADFLVDLLGSAVGLPVYQYWRGFFHQSGK